MNSQAANGKAVLIAGPTASGKSALALQLAQTHDAVIINADSMQVYRDLRIITARPTPEEEAQVPHRLYGHVDAAVNFSAGHWVADAAVALAQARAQNRLPIFVGGSGLHAELARRDQATAERLRPRDRTRIARALEVIESTGRSLTDWHRDGLPPLLPQGQFSALFLAPDRDQLYARIDARFDAMLAAGAPEEVAALAARHLDPLLPAMKAHGVPVLIRHLKGEITLEEAATIARADTRHYAKRQFTWFRHQLPEFEWKKPDEAGRWLDALRSPNGAKRNPGQR